MEATSLRPASSGRPTASGHYGWFSRLRSYFIFDPLIWLITVVLGIISIPVSLLGEKGRILHGFARFWSQLIMKIICSPTKVTGLDRIDTSKPLCLRGESCLGAGYSGAVRLLALSVSHRVQERTAGVSDRGMAPEAVGADLR